MLGHFTTDPPDEEYLFLNSNDEIFKLHSETLAVKKVTLKETKLLITLGYDLMPQYDDEEEESQVSSNTI